MSTGTHSMFLWRTDENYPAIIIKYPNYLFQCYCEILTSLFLCWQTIWRQAGEKEVSMTAPKNKLLNFLSIWMMSLKCICNEEYCKNPKISDTQKICCNHHKSWTRWLFLRLMHPKPKDAAGIANSVDPEEQSDLGLHCLPRSVCLKT